jgi:NADH-quinone oxidoreductase subunit M
VAAYQLAGALLLVVGIALSFAGSEHSDAGLWLIIGAVLIRKGILPFHAWLPEAFDRGRIGPTVLFSAPQLGTYVAATLVLPHASPTMLRTMAILSLVTAVYGAALALFQSDARRTLGYLFVSQSALVLAGLDGTSQDALTGALVLWISSALAFTGLARTVLALEARRGRLRLTTYHGGFDQMPLLATSFLLFGLACTGFPGTLGFVGQEMLIDGAVRDFPALGFLTIAAAALTGLAVLRMYFSLFCGRPSSSSGLPLRWREAIVFGGIATLLVVGGVLPSRGVRSLQRASVDLLRLRDRASGHGEAQASSPAPARQ